MRPNTLYDSMAVKFLGLGSCIPGKVVDESAFLSHSFFDSKGVPLDLPNEKIIEKFKSITGIEQRRYAEDKQVASDLGFLAAEKAIKQSGIDTETLSGIICAHNYGDIPKGTIQSDTVPSLAARIKHRLKIKNPSCVAFDVMFGCPGWLQSVIIAEQFLKNNKNGCFLVISTETLSRVTDPHDRDSMIYADGAGAVVLANENDSKNLSGILSTASKSFTDAELLYLHFGKSYKNDAHQDVRFIKMNGRKIYEFALKNVPIAMKECLDIAGVDLKEVKRIILHQANEKMDEAILARLYKLYKEKEIPENIMPMSIARLGNSSVATIPTLLDLIFSGEMPDFSVEKGDILLMASVGAGMNINAVTYRV